MAHNRKHLDLANAVQYVHSLENEALDGLYFACKSKMAELGVSADKSLAAKHPAVEGLSPTGNLRSLIDWVNTLESPVEGNRGERKAHAEDCRSLAVLHSVVRANMRAAKYDPAETATQDDVDKQLAAEREKHRQAAEEARAKAIAAQREKLAADVKLEELRKKRAAEAAAEEKAMQEAARAEREERRVEYEQAREKARQEALEARRVSAEAREQRAAEIAAARGA